MIQFLEAGAFDSYHGASLVTPVYVSMADNKPHQFRPPLYHGDGNGRSNGSAESQRHGGPAARRAGNQKEGWDAYRKWMSRVSGPAPRRSPVDASIYSWKGYHNWAEKVKQNWKPE